jgi:hypothetical protein
MTITIPRTERPPQIEDFLVGGQLMPPVDGASTRAAVAGDPRGIRVTAFGQREPGDGDPPSQPTAAYLSYDNANLYVVFVCHDEPGAVRANIARREDIGEDDRVTVYLDTFHARQRAYQFDSNPLGVQRDGIRSESTGNVDLTFDEVWSSEGRVFDNGYVVRLAIPFRSLRFRPGGEQTWGIAVGRIISRENERTFWPHITKRRQGFVSQFGNADGLAEISPGRNMQVIPYAMAARARVLDDEIPDHVNEGDERIGLDAKMVVRDALTLDLTLNPDFSQVESDDPQVTVNERFEVFFPERRPFFLENADYFQTPEQLFFSRRIIDPGVGFRTTGKVGRWAIGALVMNDRAALQSDEPAAGNDAWIGAARVERELGEESAVGLLATDREFTDSDKYDRMLAADARFRLGDNWELIGQLMQSQNREHYGRRIDDWGMRGDLKFRSRTWEGSAGYREFGPNFRAPLGFVNRWNYRRLDFDGQYTFFLPESDMVREFGPKLEMKWLWDHGSGVLTDRELELIFAVEMVRSSEIELVRIQAYELFEGFGFDLYSNQLTFKTEWFSWLGADLSYLWGTEVNHDPAEELDPERGRASEAEIGLTLRPTVQLRFEGSYVDSRLHREHTSEHLFTERLLRARFDYQFSRLLSLRAIFDYGWEDFNTERVDADDPRVREFAMDFLLTYLLHPGTALYLGFTDARENLRLVGSPPEEIERSQNPHLSVGRQIFVKASYLVRF